VVRFQKEMHPYGWRVISGFPKTMSVERRDSEAGSGLWMSIGATREDENLNTNGGTRCRFGLGNDSAYGGGRRRGALIDGVS
jgi:hypothetical protein